MIGVAGFVLLTTVSYAAYKLYKKAWGCAPLNRYDDEDTVASLPGHCVFCKIIHENKEIVYKDNKCVAFHDKWPKSRVHFQVIPLRHIKNI